MKEQKVTTQEEAIEFLKKYTDDEVYTHKCITWQSQPLKSRYQRNHFVTLFIDKYHL